MRSGMSRCHHGSRRDGALRQRSSCLELTEQPPSGPAFPAVHTASRTTWPKASELGAHPVCQQRRSGLSVKAPLGSMGPGFLSS